MRVFINPGHSPNGHPDPGAVNHETGLRESDVAESIGKMVRGYLSAAGCEVDMLQSDNLLEVVEASNEWCADVFVSIHCNSFSNPEAQGAECWHYYASTEGKKLAGFIQAQLVNSLPLVDRGTKGAKPGVNGLYVLTTTDAVACLVETAFISNEHDEALLRNDMDEFARAIARGVTDYACSF